MAIGVAIALALPPRAWWRAAMFGTAAAISFAFTSACTKSVADFAAHDVASLYRHWQTYALAAFGALAVFLAQNAYPRGPDRHLPVPPRSCWSTRWPAS